MLTVDKIKESIKENLPHKKEPTKFNVFENMFSLSEEFKSSIKYLFEGYTDELLYDKSETSGDD